MPVAGLLGRNPSAPGAVGLKLMEFVDTAALFPKVPVNFGHAALAKSLNLGMMANDEWGDCVAAGTVHRHQLSSKIHGTPATFSTDNALEFYAAANGHPFPIPGGAGGPNDQGTDMATAAKLERKTGVKDASGKEHKITLYAEVEAGNITDLVVAMYLFDEVGMGIQVQQDQQQQFEDGKPWSWVKGSPVVGGHYVVGVGRTNGLIDFLTWGAVPQMKPAYWAESGDELIAHIDLDNLAGKSKQTLEHVDLAGLLKYAAELPKG